VEEGRGQEEEGDRPRGQHEGIDPGVRRRSQPADQEEQEQEGHEEEQPRRPLARLAGDHEDPDDQETEAEDRGVEVGRVAESPRAQDDGELPWSSGTAHKVGNRIADPMTVEDPGRVPGRPKDLAVDPEDPIPRPDPRPVGPRSRDNAPHDQATRRIGLEDHTVRRPRQEHVRKGQPRQERTEHAAYQQNHQSGESPFGHRPMIRARRRSCSSAPAPPEPAGR